MHEPVQCVTYEPCKLCGGVTFVWVTPYAAYHICRACGEKWPIKPLQPQITIADLDPNNTADDILADLKEPEPEKRDEDDEDVYVEVLGG